MGNHSFICYSLLVYTTIYIAPTVLVHLRVYFAVITYFTVDFTDQLPSLLAAPSTAEDMVERVDTRLVRDEDDAAAADVFERS